MKLEVGIILTSSKTKKGLRIFFTGINEIILQRYSIEW